MHLSTACHESAPAKACPIEAFKPQSLSRALCVLVTGEECSPEQSFELLNVDLDSPNLDLQSISGVDRGLQGPCLDTCAPSIVLLAFVLFGWEFAERQELGEEWVTGPRDDLLFLQLCPDPQSQLTEWAADDNLARGHNRRCPPTSTMPLTLS